MIIHYFLKFSVKILEIVVSIYLSLAAAPLASRGSIFEGQENSLNLYLDLFFKKS